MSVVIPITSKANSATAHLSYAAYQIEAQAALKHTGVIAAKRFAFVLVRFLGPIGGVDIAAQIWYRTILKRDDIGVFALDNMVYDMANALSALANSTNSFDQEIAVESIEAIYQASSELPAQDNEYPARDEESQDGPDSVPSEWGDGSSRNDWEGTGGSSGGSCLF